MKCRRCSNELEEDSIFCDKCGTKVLVEPIEQTSVKEFDEIEKTILADNIINSELINNIKVEKPQSFDISDLAPDDLDDLMPKRKHTLLITIIVILVLIGALIYIYFDLTKKDNKTVDKKVDYQEIINEYGKAIEEVTSDYLMNNDHIEDFDEIKDLVKYDKHKVVCNNIYINIDGSVYLADCSVDGKLVEEMYGMKKNILSKDNNNICSASYDKKSNSIKFYYEGELLSIYECEDDSCSLYKNENFSYNSCLDKLAVIKDGDKFHFYNYQSAMDIFDPFSEISSVIKDDNVIGFIARDYEKEKYGYFDIRGNTKIKFEYDTLGISYDGKTFTNSYNANNDVITASKNKKYGIIKLSNGNKVIDFKYDNIYLASKDKYIVKEDDNYYYIGKDTLRIINRSYKMIFGFDDLLVVNKDDKLYIVDFKGNNIIDDSFSVTLPYNEKPGIGGVYGYNAYIEENNLVIEIDKLEDNKYKTTRYIYIKDEKRIIKE